MSGAATAAKRPRRARKGESIPPFAPAAARPAEREWNQWKPTLLLRAGAVSKRPLRARGHSTGAAGAASCPYASVRDELVRRLRTIDAPLAAGVEAAPLYANPDWAAVKLDGWAARLAQLAAVAARGNEGPALCQGSGKRLPEASVSARVVNLLWCGPKPWAGQRVKLALPWGPVKAPWRNPPRTSGWTRPANWPGWSARKRRRKQTRRRATEAGE